MLDTMLKPKIDPYLEKMAEKLQTIGVGPNQITLYGFVVGLLGCVAIAFGSYMFGLVLILLNRITDGLDGAVARFSKSPKMKKETTALGAYLDTILDMILFGAFVFSFGFASIHAGAASFLLFSLMGVFITDLGAHMIQNVKAKTAADENAKSFYHPTRWIEGTEIIIMMVLSCVFPAAFGIWALIFGVMCWVTTISRIWDAFTTANPALRDMVPANEVNEFFPM